MKLSMPSHKEIVLLNSKEGHSHRAKRAHIWANAFCLMLWLHVATVWYRHAAAVSYQSTKNIMKESFKELGRLPQCMLRPVHTVSQRSADSGQAYSMTLTCTNVLSDALDPCCKDRARSCHAAAMGCPALWRRQ